MSTPLVSVLMPVYNADRYLSQAIDSILQQTFTDFEFLIIDDGSTDRSRSILERYAQQDQRIRLISRPNTGYVVALNEMLALAQGELLARMDADDISLPDRFQRQVAFLQQHPQVTCVGGTHELIDHRGRLLFCLQPPLSDAAIQQSNLTGHNAICHPCVLMRRSAVLAAGGYDESLMPAEDLDLWFKLGEMGELANLVAPVLKYRLHANSVSERDCLLQRQKMREACERAWQRRGIQGQFEASEPWRPGKDAESRHRYMLQYGWWAFNSQQRSTAAIYGLHAIRAQPLKPEGWNLLACALIKPLPEPPSYSQNCDLQAVDLNRTNL